MPDEQHKDVTMIEEKPRRLSGSSTSKGEAGIVIDTFDKNIESAYGMFLLIITKQ